MVSGLVCLVLQLEAKVKTSLDIIFRDFHHLHFLTLMQSRHPRMPEILVSSRFLFLHLKRSKPFEFLVNQKPHMTAVE